MDYIHFVREKQSVARVGFVGTHKIFLKCGILPLLFSQVVKFQLVDFLLVLVKKSHCHMAVVVWPIL